MKKVHFVQMMTLVVLTIGVLSFVSCNGVNSSKQKTSAESEITRETPGHAKATKDEEAAEKAVFEDKVALYSQMDLNKDNKVDEKEYQAYVKKEFAKLDKNNNGKLEKNEIKNFNEYNKNGDEYITVEEFKNKKEIIFDKIDTDSSGYITNEEVEVFEKK